MAWIRTGLSMLTFGFSVIKFFQFLRQEGVDSACWTNPRASSASRSWRSDFVALGLATWTYIQSRRQLGATARLFNSPTLIVTAVLLVIQGLALFWALTGR